MKELKKFLDGISNYDAEVKFIERQIEQMNEMNIPGAETHINGLIAKISRMKLEELAVSKAVNRVRDPIARMIYTARYILGDQWKNIAENCGGMSERNAHYIHDKSFDELEVLVNDELDKAGVKYV